jgi:hypothetical protein
MAHIGHPLVGDPVYGRLRTIPADLRISAGRTRRFWLYHPGTQALRFESVLPEDFTETYSPKVYRRVEGLKIAPIRT